jgi:uncharacterized membrane protein YccC
VDHLVLLLPLVDAIEDRLAQLRQGGGVSPALGAAGTDARLDGAAARRAFGHARGHGGGSARLARRADAQSWSGLMELNLHARLLELVRQAEASQWLVEHTLAPPPLAARPARALVRERVQRLAPRCGLAFRSALAAVIGVFGSCMVWIYTSWPEGGVMAMICAVVCSFFATLDDPAPRRQAGWCGPR